MRVSGCRIFTGYRAVLHYRLPARVMPCGPLLGRIAFLELIPEVVGRAREPFPVEVRTLDALHLAPSTS